MAILRGEVWLVNLDPSIADEIRKTRPAVVVSRDSIGVLALRVIVPFTNWRPQFSDCDWLVGIDPEPGNGLDKTSAADTFQVRSVSSARFVRRLGRVSAADLERIRDALKLVLEI